MFLLNIDKRFFLFVALLLTFFIKINAQTELKIGGNAGSIAPSAAFEVQSTTKGLLLPRMTTAQMNLISSPATGLMIYNTDLNCVHYYFGAWKSQCDPANLGAWSLLGNVGTNAANNFIGTTDNVPFSIRVENTRSGYFSKTQLFLGYQAGRVNTSTESTFLGVESGYSNTTGEYNLGVGKNALRVNTTGSFNSAIGYSALALNTIGGYNTAVGTSTLFLNTTGENNTAIGVYSLTNNTTGTNNTGLGLNSLSFNTVGNYNTGSGINSLYSNTIGSYNTATGSFSAASNTTGVNNTAMGYAASSWNTTGSRNSTFGYYAGYGASGAVNNDNSFFGHFSGAATTSGSNNTGLGSEALKSVITGSNNTALGYRAGAAVIDGSNNLLLGYQSDVTVGTLSKAAAIGYNAKVSANNSLVLGGTGADAVNVGIGVTAPAYKLDINATSNPLRMSGLQVGTSADSVLTVSSAIVKRMRFSDMVAGNAWSLLGNSGTVDGTNFIGTIDNKPFNIRVNNQKAGRIDYDVSGETYFGYQAGNASNTVSGVTAIGYQAGRLNTGNENTFTGYQTGYSNTTGNENTFTGYQAGYSNTTGYFNLFTGNQAGRANTTGVGNVALGYFAGNSNTTGSSNVAVGYAALKLNTIEGANTAIGSQSMENSTIGEYNVAVGASTLKSNKSSNNVAIGYQALYENTTGNANIGIGTNAAGSNTTGVANTAVGYGAMINSTTGSSNTAIGDRTLYGNISGTLNNALGVWSMYGNTTGSGNTALGTFALTSNNTGNDNVAIGNNALYTTNGSRNVGLGNSAGSRVSSGTDNLLLGNAAGDYLTTGSRNIVLGYQSGAQITTGNNNTLIGVGANVTASGGAFTNATALGYNAIVGASNSLVLGGTGADAVNVGIGLTIPAYKLDIASTANPVRMTGLQTGAATDDVVTTDAAGVLKKQTAGSFVGNNAWALNGNAVSAIKTLGTTSNFDLPFITNNTEKMRITASGNVGIGIVAPSYKLDVAGSFRIASASAGGGYLRTWGETDIEYDGGADGLYSFRNSTTGGSTRFLGDVEIMRLLNNGNVGVGTGTPGTKLDVNGALAVSSSSVTVTADNQVITVGNRSFLKITSYGLISNSTITLTNGLSDGQILYISIISDGSGGLELLDAGNLSLTGIAQLNDKDTIQLLWDGSSWNEITRSGN